MFTIIGLHDIHYNMIPGLWMEKDEKFCPEKNIDKDYQSKSGELWRYKFTFSLENYRSIEVTKLPTTVQILNLKFIHNR